MTGNKEKGNSTESFSQQKPEAEGGNYLAQLFAVTYNVLGGRESW